MTTHLGKAESLPLNWSLSIKGLAMRTIAPGLNSSASVALLLLTNAAARSARGIPPLRPAKMPDDLDTAAIKSAAHSSGIRITLGMEGAEKAYGPGSFLMQTARGRADQVEISTSVIPSDKHKFRSDVLAFLGENMKSDTGFMAAFNAGQVAVLTVDEVPELNIQPMVSFSMYRNGHYQGGRANLHTTRNQPRPVPWDGEDQRADGRESRQLPVRGILAKTVLTVQDCCRLQSCKGWTPHS